MAFAGVGWLLSLCIMVRIAVNHVLSPPARPPRPCTLVDSSQHTTPPCTCFPPRMSNTRTFALFRSLHRYTGYGSAFVHQCPRNQMLSIHNRRKHQTNSTPTRSPDLRFPLRVEAGEVGGGSIRSTSGNHLSISVCVYTRYVRYKKGPL